MSDNDSGAEQPEPRGVGPTETGKSGDAPSPSAPPTSWDSQNSTTCTWIACPKCGMLTPQDQPHAICPTYAGEPYTTGTWKCSLCGGYVYRGTIHYCGAFQKMQGTPFKCPVCDGTGLVSRPPGVAADQQEWVSYTAGPFSCRACGGSGVLWG